jgi:hypothetical protein
MTFLLVWVCLGLSSNGGELAAAPAQNLAEQIRSNFISRTNNGSPQMFSKYVDGKIFMRNASFWLRGMHGLTGIHVGYGPGASVITPWHVVGANHWKNDAGAQLVFCDPANHSIVRTVVAGTEIRPDVRSDIWLAVLDKPLPESITPLLLMPTNWVEKISFARLPVAALNQAQCFGSGELFPFHQQARGWFEYGYVFKRSSAVPTMQFEPRRAGDSGRPIVTLLGTNLALVSHLTFETGDVTFAGPDYSAYAADIQSAIEKVGTNAIAKAQKIGIAKLRQ